MTDSKPSTVSDPMFDTPLSSFGTPLGLSNATKCSIYSPGLCRLKISFLQHDYPDLQGLPHNSHVSTKLKTGWHAVKTITLESKDLNEEIIRLTSALTAPGSPRTQSQETGINQEDIPLTPVFRKAQWNWDNLDT